MPPRIVESTVFDPSRSKTGGNTKFPQVAAAMVAAHPARKSLSQESRPGTRRSLGTEIPAPRVFTVEPLGYAIREHKIRSRLESQSSQDGSSDEERLQNRHHGATHLKYVIYELRVTTWKGLKCTQRTIFRRYHDFEELNEMLPANIAHMARLPGRRYWARLTGSRFTAKAIEEREHAVVRYLERLLALVPDFDPVQMFICDDWLSRDTTIRRRQFMRVVAHQNRLKQLISARTQAEGWGEATRPTATGPVRKPYVASPLGPNGKSRAKKTLKPPAQLIPPPSPRLDDSSSSKSLGTVHMSHPRVRSIREEEWDEPRPLVYTCPDQIHLSHGTPAQRTRKWAKLPRTPLPADR